MRKIGPYMLEKCVEFSPVLFCEFGQKPGFENFLSAYGQFFFKKAQKKWAKARF